jgi:hypothetical protein
VRKSFYKLLRKSLCKSAQKFCLACIAIAMLSGTFAHAATLTDPTQPSGTSAAATPGHSGSSIGGLKLSLIRLGNQPRAVINGQSLRPGDAIDGYQLVAVQAGAAVLSGPGGRLVLPLAPSLKRSSTTL